MIGSGGRPQIKMLTLFLLIFLCLCDGTDEQQQPVVVSVLNQIDHFIRPYNDSNKLMCDEFTDVLPVSLLNVADDFVLPLDSELASPLASCSALQLQMTVLLVKNQAYPGSLTVQFLANNASSNSPGAVIYSKTLSSPDSSGIWNVPVDTPTNISIQLANGELADDGETALNFGDPAFMPRHTTMWLAFFLRGAYVQSSMFWLLLDAQTNSNPLQKSLYGQVNRDYFYRDVENLEQFGFTTWTDAAIVEPLFQMASGTFNMAFSLQFLCPAGNGSTVPPTGNTTLLPIALNRNSALFIACLLFFVFLLCIFCVFRRLRRAYRIEGVQSRKKFEPYKPLNISSDDGELVDLSGGDTEDDDKVPRKSQKNAAFMRKINSKVPTTINTHVSDNEI